MKKLGLNVVVCADCGCEIDLENAVENRDYVIINGEYYCMDCVFECAYCGKYHLKSDNELTEVDGDVWCDNCVDDYAYYCEQCCEYHNSDNFYEVETRYGTQWWCEDCVESDAFKCEHCGIYHSNNDYDSYEVRSRGYNETWCSDCVSDYAMECADCGELFDVDDMQYHEDDDCYYCEDCFEEHDNIIKAYHDAPCLKFVGNPKKIWKGLQHYLGIELEVDNGYDREDCAKEIAKIEQNVYFNRDGSLNNGFEIITQPHTEEAFYKINWQKIFDICKQYGFSSHDAGTCGLHIHISRQWLGSTKDAQDLAVRKLILFYHTYWYDIVKLSRRTEHQANDWAQDYCVNNRKELAENIKYKNYGRYYAINNCNRNTVEFRLGRGTLNAESFYAWIDFNLTLVKNIKKVKMADLVNPQKWLVGLKPTTIKYIQEKGAFKGAL